MKHWVQAVAIALALHGLLAMALAVYLVHAPEPEVLAELDLSSVELSLADEDHETAAVAPAPPSAERPAPKPPPSERPPETKPERQLPPDPSAAKFPEPREDVRLETRDVKPREDARQETRDVKGGEAPAVAPRQARVDAPPRPRRTIRPEYPKGARQRGEQGEVTLEIRVSGAGAVEDVSVVASSGFAELDEAAVKAARSAKFSPARSGREAVASTARLKLQFKLK